MKILDINTIRSHYLECALWTNNIDDKSIFDFRVASYEKADKVINTFLQKAREPINIKALETYCEFFKGTEESQLGHDIWLSHNGHGAGFFDHSLGGLEDVLQNICRDIPPVNEVWVSEIGILFIE